MCSAPTGSGKGVILEEILSQKFVSPIFSRKKGSKAIVLVPLNALGRQTGERLRRVGVNAHFFDGKILSSTDVLILGPERLNHSEFKRWVVAYEIEEVFIDECHCIEDWGSGFRPAFKDFYLFLKSIKPKRTFWMSGTIPKDSFKKIQDETRFDFKIHGGFELPKNLGIEFFRLTAAQRFSHIESNLLVEDGKFKIVFCNTRKEAENWSTFANARHRSCAFYHAGLSAEERVGLERSLQVKPSSLLFATSAFGMGMDFNHLDWSIVTSAPYSPLALIQALGRAGRGQKSGRGTVLWAETDFRWNAQRSLSDHQKFDLKRLRELLEIPGLTEKESLLKEYFL
jgi:ATP-dependent DNA helicase RecQ